MTVIIPAEILKHLIELVLWSCAAFSFSLQSHCSHAKEMLTLQAGTCRLLKMSDKRREKKPDASKQMGIDGWLLWSFH